MLSTMFRTFISNSRRMYVGEVYECGKNVVALSRFALENCNDPH